MRRLLPIAAALLALALLAGCGGDDDDSTPGDAERAADKAGGGGKAKAPDNGKRKAGGAGGGERKAGGSGIAIQTADSQFGEVLFDADERAVYLFDKEGTDRSRCYGACAEAWPPVLTKGEPRAEGGADDLLGTTKRDDGTTQVTYNGHPLYYYVEDPPGQVLCHNVEEFGGLWLVVEASGDAVQ